VIVMESWPSQMGPDLRGIEVVGGRWWCHQQQRSELAERDLEAFPSGLGGLGMTVMEREATSPCLDFWLTAEGGVAM
jgi:hypothetical protein